MTEPVVQRAHGKLNVFLRVLGARDDGFHDIATVILPVDLADTVTVTPARDLSVEVSGGTGAIPEDERNLAYGAAVALAERAGIARPGARIRIDKRIPAAAGMGGGSADAAATIRGLDALWACGLDDVALAEVAAAVGADVPALLHGGAVFADGRGTRVTPVHAATTWWVVMPLSLQIASADAYAWWDEDGSTGPDPGALVAAIETGDVELLATATFNDLQAPVARRHPEVDVAIAAFLEAGALGAVMTGSGPTVVAIARHAAHAGSLAKAVPGSFAVSGPATAVPDRQGAR